MGKGKRTKQERATGVLVNTPAKKNATSKRSLPTWAGTLIVVLVLVLLVSFCTVTILASRGVFLRNKVIAATEHFEVTVPMMAYMVYSEYDNWVSTYQNTGYMQYIKGTGGESLSTSKPLRDQIYSSKTDEVTNVTETKTWFDYFAESASVGVKQVLVLCEQAYYYGVALDEADLAQIDRAIENLELIASYYGYNLTGYLSANFGGNPVNESDVRAMMEMTQLATKFSTLKQEEFENGVTDVRIEKHYNDNKDDYEVYVDYLGYEWKAEFKPVADTVENAETKNAELYAKYLADQKKYNDRVEALKACTTPESFSATLLGYLIEDEKDACDKDHDPEATENKCETDHNAAALKKQDKANYLDYEKSDDSSDLEKWLYNDERKADETTVIKEEHEGIEDDGDETTEDPYTEANSTYGAYYMIRTKHPADKYLQNVGHILFKDATFKDMTDTSKLSGKTKELAQKVLDNGMALTAENMSKQLLADLFAEGKITAKTEGTRTYYVMDKSVFEEYGATYTEDSNIFYEDDNAVKAGQMVAEFESWAFDENRREGEISYPAAIKTTYGYHIMYYVSKGDIQWRSEIVSALKGEDYEAWYKTVSEATAITTEQSYWSLIQ